MQPAEYETWLWVFVAIIGWASMFAALVHRNEHRRRHAADREVRAVGYSGPERRSSPPDHYNGNGDDTLMKWAKVIGFVGIPGAALFFILYFAVPELPKGVRALEGFTREMQFNRERTEELIKIAKRQNLLTIRACRAAARDQITRDGCDAD